MEHREAPILVTGATGYVGGRLVPRLLERGERVRVLVRDARRIRGRPWGEEVEVHEGDLLEPETLAPALEGAGSVYYLVHSMTAGDDFAERDRRAAVHLATAAREAGPPELLVYLGGLVPDGEEIASEHLESRAEVGAVLRDRLPTTEFRAGPIIGSGSASFEMVRYLTERLPAMVAPRWILNRVRPIAIRDVLSYLVSALDREPLGVVEIGADTPTFRRMMQTYAEVRGLRRIILPVPVLAPALAARWVGLVTPISNRLAVPLVRGVVQPVTGDTSRARRLFPGIDPVRYREAVELALESLREGEVETRWSGAFGAAPTYELRDSEGLVRECRSRPVKASREATFRAFAVLGGERGWRVWSLAWRLRGLLDQLVGGPGLRRGRRDPEELLEGEALDFWRVERVRPPELLRLKAEMKLPGRAWLEWRTEPAEGGARLVQTAIFAPRGLGGLVYWYGLYPLHRVIFSQLADALVRDAERGSPAPACPPSGTARS